MKRVFSIVCAAALALSVVGCSSQANTDAAQSTDNTQTTKLVGQITEIDGNNVTLALVDTAQATEKAEKPEKSENADAPALPETDADATEGKPEKGEKPTRDEADTDAEAGATENTQRPEKADRENAEDAAEANTMKSKGTKGNRTITLTGETTTIDLKDVTITGHDNQELTVADLTVGDYLTVEMNNNTTVSATLATGRSRDKSAMQGKPEMSESQTAQEGGEEAVAGATEGNGKPGRGESQDAVAGATESNGKPSRGESQEAVAA